VNIAIDIDFGARRPWVVTQILARCAGDADGRLAPDSEDEVWRWSVPQRTQALLGVARACGISSVAALASCDRAGCGERIELEFELESFARTAEPGAFAWKDAGQCVNLRLPTGDDQRRWADALPVDDPGLPAWIGAQLVRDVDGTPLEEGWQLPESWLPGVEAALADQDPATDLRVGGACTSCGAGFSAEIDLEALLLGRLARLQQDLLLDVHLLARSYHWSEAQILALPAWRRAYYLAALGAET
jgi:hypothetical protein